MKPLRGFLSFLFLTFISFAGAGAGACCFSPSSAEDGAAAAGDGNTHQKQRRRKISPFSAAPAPRRRQALIPWLSSVRLFLSRAFSGAGAGAGAQQQSVSLLSAPSPSPAPAPEKKHSLAELTDDDSGKSIVRMIFLSGWSGRRSPAVHRILRVHHTQRALARFEEFRDAVRARAAAGDADERCIADGNERLLFHCSTTLCSLAGAACSSPYCCTCNIIKHGFAGKQSDLDGVATYSSSSAAHAALPEELEREFAFLPARRVMLVCRVVAGRVGAGGEAAVVDSVVVPAGRHAGGEKVVVFNPRAVLPCFVVVYAV